MRFIQDEHGDAAVFDLWSLSRACTNTGRVADGRTTRRVTLVAGVDSSTQSCKVVIRDAETGELVRHGRAVQSWSGMGRA